MVQQPCWMLRGQQVLHQRWISGTHCMQATKHIWETTVALKPRADVMRSQKQGYQWPHKKDWYPPNFLNKVQTKSSLFMTTDNVLLRALLLSSSRAWNISFVPFASFTVEPFKHDPGNFYPQCWLNILTIQFQGQGTEKNETKAMELISKAAEQVRWCSKTVVANFVYWSKRSHFFNVSSREIKRIQFTTCYLSIFLCCFPKGHIQAINAVGWYALEKERNATKAVQYFEQAYNRGSADAAHNLGHIYYSALYPEIGHDRVRHMFAFFINYLLTTFLYCLFR